MKAPTDDDGVHEIKFDGYRMAALFPPKPAADQSGGSILDTDDARRG